MKERMFGRLRNALTVHGEKELTFKLRSIFRISMVTVLALLVIGIPHLSEGRDMLFWINVVIAGLILVAFALLMNGLYNTGRSLLIFIISTACMSFYIPFG